VTRRAVVIGSGFGGLAAAVRLGARGYRVTLLERLGEAGGRARVHRQDGFTFDAGPTIVTAPFLFEELWALCGRSLADDVELRSLDPFYRIRFDDGRTFDVSADADCMRAQIARFEPGDVRGYDRLQEISRKIYEVGFERLGREPFDRATDMLKALPALVRLQGYRSVYGLVSRYIRNPQLRMVFSFHPLLVGGNPLTTTAVYTLIAHLEKRWGVHYVMGGTGRLVAALVDLIEGLGGTLRFDAEVERIVVRDGEARGVVLKSGETIDADVVVSNADPLLTYGTLIPPEQCRGRNARTRTRMRSSMSLFVWYFGTDRTYDELPHHMILMGPRYRELLRDIFDRHWLADDMSLYLHRPTATDPSVAPDGCDAFYVLSPVPHLDAGIDWQTAAEPYRRRIAERLEATVLPGLRSHVVTSRVTTPLEFQDQLLSFRGAAFGPEPVLTQSAWFRPHNRSEDVANLYLVGAGTHPGAGLPGVVSSAAVLERFLDDV
jgi:phytoene desaturase